MNSTGLGAPRVDLLVFLRCFLFCCVLMCILTILGPDLAIGIKLDPNWDQIGPSFGRFSIKQMSMFIDPEIDRKSVGRSSDRSIGRSVDFPLISGNFWATLDFGPKICDFPGGGPVWVSSRGQMNRPLGWGTTQDALGATSDGVTPAFLAWGNPI